MTVKENIKKINKCHIDIQSFLLLLNDKKPVIRLNVFKEYINELKELSKIFKLTLLIEDIKELYGEKFEKTLIFAYLSKEKKIAQIAYQAEMDNDRGLFGKMLGYPKCCVEKLQENLLKGQDYVGLLVENSKGKSYYYQCNNIFNYDSKVGLEDTLRTYQKNIAIFSQVEKNFLIRHIPCSFCCEESKKIGNDTLELLEIELPELAREIVSVIKKPIIYFDYFNWIVLEGDVEKNEIKYFNILPINSLVSSRIIDELKRGDTIKIELNRLIVFKKNKQINKIETEKNGKILNFR